MTTHREHCPINRCGRPLGIGTHMSLAAGRDGKSQQTLAVCEEHWQALRDIFPMELTSAE